MTDAFLENTGLRRLFFGLALLYVLPFWTVHYLPTVDGPCHTYNAWILRQYGNVEQYPLFQKYYEINARPYANWISQGGMALLMFLVPPLAAEKIFVSLYALLLLSGVWYLAGIVEEGRRWLAFLAFPFVHNHMFQFGFYNFSMSLALFPWIVGFWWRHRERGGLGYVVGINLLLWLCYFAHILSFGLALVSVAVLWLATLRRDNWRRHVLMHVPVLAPQGFLPLWHLMSQRGGEASASIWPLFIQARYLLELHALFTFDKVQRWLAVAVAVTFGGLVLLTLVRRRKPFPREEDAFLLLAVVLTVLYFLSPEAMGGGSMIKVRVSLYPWLVLIPWLSPGLSPGEGRARGVFVSGLALVWLLNAGYLVHWYRLLEGDMKTYLAGLDAVRSDTRILPLQFEPNLRAEKVNVLTHAASYVALEKGLVDWDNYEAATAFFPTRFRDSAPPPVIWEIEATPGQLRLQEWRDRADYIYVWRMPPGHPLRNRLRRPYGLISARDGGELWERRGRRQETR